MRSGPTQPSLVAVAQKVIVRTFVSAATLLLSDAAAVAAATNVATADSTIIIIDAPALMLVRAPACRPGPTAAGAMAGACLTDGPRYA